MLRFQNPLMYLYPTNLPYTYTNCLYRRHHPCTIVYLQGMLAVLCYVLSFRFNTNFDLTFRLGLDLVKKYRDVIQFRHQTKHNGFTISTTHHRQRLGIRRASGPRTKSAYPTRLYNIVPPHRELRTPFSKIIKSTDDKTKKFTFTAYKDVSKHTQSIIHARFRWCSVLSNATYEIKTTRTSIDGTCSITLSSAINMIQQQKQITPSSHGRSTTFNEVFAADQFKPIGI